MCTLRNSVGTKLSQSSRNGKSSLMILGLKRLLNHQVINRIPHSNHVVTLLSFVIHEERAAHNGLIICLRNQITTPYDGCVVVYANTMMIHRKSYNHIPNGLKAHRLAKGLTQQQVATLLRLKNNTLISRWEVGKSFPDIPNLVKLCWVYEASFEELFGELNAVIRDGEIHSDTA